MSKPIKLAVLLPCYGPHITHDRFKLCLDSALAQCISPAQMYVYGQGEQYKTLRHSKVDDMLALLPKVQSDGWTHVLMVDALDSTFVRPVKKIIEAYRLAGEPGVLCSAEMNCYPNLHFAPMIEVLHQTEYKYKYPNTGGWMGRIDAVQDLWERGLKLYGGMDNDQGIMQSLLVDGGGWDVELDSECRVWQCSPDHDAHVKWERNNGGLMCVNKHTKSAPCVLHFNGGYADPIEGKKERMMWAWERLYAN